MTRGDLRFWDERLGAWSVSVLAGEVYVTDTDEYITTVLGSCVSTCVRDRVTGAGGMNHLALPDGGGRARDVTSDNQRCLDRLVGGVLGYGGRMADLEIKVFGGGKINGALDDIGLKNIEFVREFLANEGYEMAKEDLGGTYARRVMFKPYSGRAFIKRLDNTANASIAKEELAVAASRRSIITKPVVDDIELF